MRPMHGIAALTFAAGLFSPRLHAQVGPAGGAAPNTRPRAGAKGSSAACPVEGVWELVSMSYNGQDLPRPGYHERKLISHGQFMWFGEEARRDTIPLRTVADTLRAFRVTGGAGGYTVAGNNYTERLDYFYDPRMIGQSVQATCRIDGDRWYHSFTAPTSPTGGGEQPARIEQVWRRVG